jgi:hypothetical protein
MIYKYFFDTSIGGDVAIVPRGVMSLVSKETINGKRENLFAKILNPALSSFFKPLGVAELLRHEAADADIDPDKLILTGDELIARSSAEQTANANANANATIEKPNRESGENPTSGNPVDGG